jgi:hypothetical protein
MDFFRGRDDDRRDEYRGNERRDEYRGDEVCLQICFVIRSRNLSVGFVP